MIFPYPVVLALESTELPVDDVVPSVIMSVAIAFCGTMSSDSNSQPDRITLSMGDYVRVQTTPSCRLMITLLRGSTFCIQTRRVWGSRISESFAM